ncbi:MAG: bifunctional UDP-N-acetylglucosamine diphosphorylase/glucosamine-1-phosphate N-acetyltransferase GlmU [Thermoflexales bacterium]|nr:bifunctional UDP-N-acetylglucosamine diphosphorylase/glucosamine-1-phosphate N-acetyltransferase GlmU [Thermoflexales bacterium]
MTNELAVVILAAGQGTRMKSDLPKVLHPLAGRPMLAYSLELAAQLSPEPPVLVVGHGADAVRQAAGDRARCVEQSPQLGTGHAVLQAAPLLKGNCQHLIVFYADMPLFRLETLQGLIEQHRGQAATLTVLTVEPDTPRGFGRILRDEAGRVTAIVEEHEATPAQRAIRELNTGLYVLEADWLWAQLPRLPLSPKGEYYLTDLVLMAAQAGRRVESSLCADPSEALGINTRAHLAEAETLARKRINEQVMLAGVTLVDPATTYIEAGVQVGADTIIYPNTHVQGNTRIGGACIIGPNTIIRSSTIGSHCEIEASVVEGATLEDEVDVGPFAHLRKGAYLCRGVHMGNFGEVKNSRLGPGTKMGHFSYLGDATTGANVNIGCGTITCNYDGQRKHPTVIEDGAFIGSDTMLIAPVRVGYKAKTGAGSVVTHDVPDGAIAYGVPAHVKIPPSTT